MSHFQRRDAVDPSTDMSSCCSVMQICTAALIAHVAGRCLWISLKMEVLRAWQRHQCTHWFQVHYMCSTVRGQPPAVEIIFKIIISSVRCVQKVLLFLLWLLFPRCDGRLF